VYRPILLNLWYPTASRGGVAMPYADYFDGAKRAATPGTPLATYATALIDYQRSVAERELVGIPRDSLTPAVRQRLDALFAGGTTVHRDAPMQPGRWPVVVYQPGAGSSYDDNVLLFELLASHGYLVVGSAYPREDNSDFGTSTNSYDLQADWSSRGMPRHMFNSSVNAQLPLGVFMSTTATASSGRFYSITTGKDDNQDGITNDRPPGVGRNGVNGPERINLDLNISKAIFLGGADGGGTRKNVNVFANMTNALNRTHYGNPSGVMSSSNFGRFTSATDPREVEAGVRFQF
jgi:hypothetical protein